MSVLNWTTSRLAKATAVGALGAAIVIGSTACGAGKISQTTHQAAAVNAANGSIVLDPAMHDGEELYNGRISLTNVQIHQPTKGSDETFRAGGPFDVSFAIANDSVTHIVKLTGVTAPSGGSVTMTPPSGGDSKSDPMRIQPNQTLLAGVQAGVDTAAAEAADIHRMKVTLNGTGKSVAPGLTTPLEFKFEVFDLAGKSLGTKSITIDTPVDSTAIDERADVVRDAQNGGGSGNH